MSQRCAARAWLLAVLLAVLGWGRDGAAFCRTTVCPKCPLNFQTGCVSALPVAWTSSCVTFSLQRDGSALLPGDAAKLAIDRAFASWQAVRCPAEQEPPSIQVRTTFGDAQCHRHEYNQTDGNANIVMFRDDDWPYTSAALALTTVTYNPNSGDIYDADMEINATVQLSVSDDLSPYDFDLQSIVTHEAGHFLGLDHSLDPAATMTTHYTPGTDSFRELSPDDIAGICAIYPPATRHTCQEEPRQGFSPTCGIAPTSGGSCAVASPRSGRTGALGGVPVVALLAGSAWQVRRRRKRAVSV